MLDVDTGVSQLAQKRAKQFYVAGVNAADPQTVGQRDVQTLWDGCAAPGHYAGKPTVR